MMYRDRQGNEFSDGAAWLAHLDALHLERTGCLATFTNGRPHTCPNATRVSEFVRLNHENRSGTKVPSTPSDERGNVRA